MRFIITGGSGFVGRHLIKQLHLQYPSIEIHNIDINQSDELDDEIYGQPNGKQHHLLQNLNLKKMMLFSIWLPIYFIPKYQFAEKEKNTLKN